MLNQDKARAAGRRLLRPLVRFLAHRGVRPATLTLTGLAVTGVAAWLAWRGSFIAASFVLLAGSVLDALDGGLARMTDTESSAGAVLDSTADRIGEALVLIGILAGVAGEGRQEMLYLVPAALVGSYLVSYVRARAEGEDIPCATGALTRTERLILLMAGFLLSGIFDSSILVYTMIALTAGTWLTAGQRLSEVIRYESGHTD